MQNLTIEKRIEAFCKLGNFISFFTNSQQATDKVTESSYYERFGNILQNLEKSNPWFIEPFVIEALKGICLLLEKQSLTDWINTYKIKENNPEPKIIGVVLAGNIPLVGFHDFLCVILTGNIFSGKLSTKDDKLFKFLTEVLIAIDPFMADYIQLKDKLTGCHAYIATGSNNTSRYFDYYFGKFPNIIRKNRTSVAVLTGKETPVQLEALTDDIFLYFGMGCRNVSKIYLPENFDPRILFPHFEKYQFIQNHVKYINNFDYYNSVYLLNQISFLENGYVILKEDNELYSPLAVIYYEYYKDIKQVNEYLTKNSDLLQCIVSEDKTIKNAICMGQAQKPMLTDYADGIDTMDFLTNL